jgi:hypothetical protein
MGRPPCPCLCPRAAGGSSCGRRPGADAMQECGILACPGRDAHCVWPPMEHALIVSQKNCNPSATFFWLGCFEEGDLDTVCFWVALHTDSSVKRCHPQAGRC